LLPRDGAVIADFARPWRGLAPNFFALHFPALFLKAGKD
jgi:hypothetical protein